MSGTLGEKRLEELGIRLLRDSKIPLAPETRDRTITIPGRHGDYFFGAESNARQFELECAFIAKTRQELEQLARQLAGHLLDRNGRPRLLQLSFDIEPDRFYTVRYSGSIALERIASFGRFVLPLTADDPFAYSAPKTLQMTVQDSAEFILQSEGNVQTEVVVMLQNTGTTINGFELLVASEKD
jgi:predicted phage tail component-like protein